VIVVDENRETSARQSNPERDNGQSNKALISTHFHSSKDRLGLSSLVKNE